MAKEQRDNDTDVVRIMGDYHVACLLISSNCIGNVSDTMNTPNEEQYVHLNTYTYQHQQNNDDSNTIKEMVWVLMTDKQPQLARH
jgi:hypothetical protein